MHGWDYNVWLRSKGSRGSTWGRWWKPPSSLVDQLIPATSCSFLNLNQNEQTWYQNEAEVMYITPVTLDCFQDLYVRRNLSLKIQVCKLKCSITWNQSHHWLSSCTRTSKNQFNTSNSHCMMRFRSKQFEHLPLKSSFVQHDLLNLLLPIWSWDVIWMQG